MLALPFLAIEIHIDPTMAKFGPFTLAWHGFFTAVGIIAGVVLAIRFGKSRGLDPEVGQAVALVGVPSAIVGARLFYVAEHWHAFSGDLPHIVTGITEGGITLYGGLIGGVVGGLAYGLYRRLPILPLLDAAAPGMILGQALGRIGDLINGEHRGTPSDLPWAVRYTQPNTLGDPGLSVHPTAGGYELLGDLVILAILLLVVARVARRPGWVFFWYALLYAGLRASLSPLRLDEAGALGLAIPQLVGFGVIAATLLLGLFLATRRKEPMDLAAVAGADSRRPPVEDAR
ncbi:MAG: prolipoprotein diacylglyceryl transferase [Thermoflexaceae bacterium]|nr:prolipoprotein diacylglyceryl transferase [Thermoflexaceae bacterium]